MVVLGDFALALALARFGARRGAESGGSRGTGVGVVVMAAVIVPAVVAAAAAKVPLAAGHDGATGGDDATEETDKVDMTGSNKSDSSESWAGTAMNGKRAAAACKRRKCWSSCRTDSKSSGLTGAAGGMPDEGDTARGDGVEQDRAA